MTKPAEKMQVQEIHSNNKRTWWGKYLKVSVTNNRLLLKAIRTARVVDVDTDVDTLTWVTALCDVKCSFIIFTSP